MTRPKSARRNRLNTTVKPVTTAAINRLAKALDMPAGRVIDAAFEAYADANGKAYGRENLDNPRTWAEADQLLASLPTVDKKP